MITGTSKANVQVLQLGANGGVSGFIEAGYWTPAHSLKSMKDHAPGRSCGNGVLEEIIQ